jgi:hypothetical protein
MCVCACVCSHTYSLVLASCLSLFFVSLLGSFLMWISIFCQVYDGLGSRKQHVPVVAFEPILQMCGILFPLLPLGFSSILAVNFDMCKLIIIQSKWIWWPLCPHDVLKEGCSALELKELQFNKRSRNRCFCAHIYFYLSLIDCQLIIVKRNHMLSTQIPKNNS